MIANIVKSLLILLICRAGSCYVLQDHAGPLYLTPYINSGSVEEGRKLAKVDPLLGDVDSYSGFLTVDEDHQKNLFFWYFPAENRVTKQEQFYNSDEQTVCNESECFPVKISKLEEEEKDITPVILWLQGGPGASSMMGLLEENGPYQVMNDGSIKLREHRWSKSFHMIYIDSPVGTGFSFAEPDVYDHNETDVSQDLYEALSQFFKLFPNLAHNEFYIAGESYAGRYIPALGHRIHQENDQKINLTGLMIGNGIVDNEFMVYGDYLAQHGLIDLKYLPEWKKDEEEYKNALRKKDYEVANDLLNLFINKTLDTGVSIYNFLETKNIDFNPLIKFFDAGIKQKIHVGTVPFIPYNAAVNNKLWENDFFMKVSTYTEKLLEKYKIMHYNGQLDIICHYPMADAYTQSLNWSGSAQFRPASQNVWKVDGKTAGFVKSGGNLYLVMVRDAGHMVPKDQPKSAFDLVTKFVNNKF